MIPKIIHYCWFGRNEKSKLLKKCMKSWKKLERAGYKFIEWNEDNCDMNANAFVRYCYENKKWAFVSDYFRLKALIDYGGIYLDTDVLVYKTFDDLLDCDFFGGFIYDCALSTAIFGAKKNNSICKDLLNVYENIKNPEINNGIFTEYFYEKVKGFKLNGKRQTIETNGERIELFPKEEFETGKVVGKSHTLHFSDCSWAGVRKKLIASIKLFSAKLPINLMAKRKIKRADNYMKKQGKYQEWYFNDANKGD